MKDGTPDTSEAKGSVPAVPSIELLDAFGTALAQWHMHSEDKNYQLCSEDGLEASVYRKCVKVYQDACAKVGKMPRQLL